MNKVVRPLLIFLTALFISLILFYLINPVTEKCGCYAGGHKWKAGSVMYESSGIYECKKIDDSFDVDFGMAIYPDCRKIFPMDLLVLSLISGFFVIKLELQKKQIAGS